MANHSPEKDNYVISKTWDEAMADKPASGEAELPAKARAVQKAESGGGAAGRNGGGAKEAK